MSKDKKTGRRKNKKERPLVVCRCEEITENEVREAIRAGHHSLEELKRLLRTGMGHCGGRGCLKVIARLIEEETGIPVATQKFPKSRPPLRPVSLGQLASYGQTENR